MSATVRADYYGNSAGEPAGVTAETGIVFSVSDAEAPPSGTSPVPQPVATGTAFSWIMLLAFDVTGTAATSLSARTINFVSAVTAGSQLFFGDQPTYRRPVSGNHPPASGSNGPATPAVTGSGAPGSYTAMTTGAQGWDATSVSAGSTGRNGDFVELVFGVDHGYAGGAGQETLPDLKLGYTES